jgi:hypothetical protein
MSLDLDAPERLPGSPEPVPGKCGSRLRGYDPPRHCLVAPMPNGRCRIHGGTSLVGIASPSFKDGRHSKYLPARLLERYEASQRDGDLLAMRDEIALLDARLSDLLERADSGDSGAAWQRLQGLWRDFARFRATGDVKQMTYTLELIGQGITGGVADHAIWGEIGQLMDRRARLVEGERRRLELTQQTLTVEEAMGMLRTVIDVIQRNVTDRAVLARIASELASLVTLDAVPLAFRGRRARRKS